MSKKQKTLGELFGIAEPLVYKEDGSWVLDKCTVGLEFEIENLRTRNHQEPHTPNVDYNIAGLWAVVSDGSLRNNGGEFVSRKLFGKDLTHALDVLDQHLRTKEPNHMFSHRTSVHVHMDIRDLTLEQLQRFLQLYCIFEIPLFKFSGGRDSNEYCIPLSASKLARRRYGLLVSPKGYLADRIQQYDLADLVVDREMKQNIVSNYVKYLALNLIPCTTKGSVEFRHHVGTADMKQISNWLNVLFHLKRAAIDYPFTNDPYIQLSSLGPRGMLEQVFQGHAQMLYYDGIDRDLWKGCRSAQDMILAIDLTTCHNKAVSSPFGHSLYSTHSTQSKADKEEGLRILQEMEAMAARAERDRLVRRIPGINDVAQPYAPPRRYTLNNPTMNDVRNTMQNLYEYRIEPAADVVEERYPEENYDDEEEI